ncbi:protein mini spindles [Bacillus rossius redtenbacheri]|uniref:protein mini spindles n=1 Tax=Bacillus rossius redtenbacheri TaxID=93214 RepID=UPI002FDCFCEB
MEEDNEYLKLPVDEKCVHKLWKARLNGYEEATKLFRQLDDEKSPEFSKYLGLVKKFVIDSNAVAQERALEAVLAYVENYALAGKTVGEVMSGIVAKCIAAPKAKTKELAIQVALMYVEIEKQEAVQEELMKGMDHKNPKIVSACISTMTLALREFGAKVITIKPLVKKISTLLEDRDKTVRDESKAMVVEIFRWVGSALRPQLSSLKPLQLSELEAEFEKVSKEKAMPTRYLRSQQKRQVEVAAAAAEDGEECDDEADGSQEIDTYDLMDPVDIISKLPKDFYEKLEAKKWQERKEAVDALEQLTLAPKLESGDYGDLVRALKKIITKDTNVMVIAVAGKCLAGLANGLKKRFQPYAGACIPAILEKFREKKQNVVLSLREAIDAIYQCTTIEAIQEDVLAALENKNPSVKAETASFLARCFTRCTPQMLTKKILKAYTAALLKTLNEPDPTVRDNSAEALGTAMKAAGEKSIMPFMTDIDNLKLVKIKECCEKAVMLVKVSKVVERPSSAPVKAQGKAPPKAGSTAAKPVKRPGTATVVAKKQPVKKSSAQPAGAKGKAVVKPMEKELSPEDLDEKAGEMFPEELISGLGDANWKTRLAAVEQLTEIIKAMDAADVSSQVVIRTLNKKPGLRDTNVQVAKARLETVKYVAETVRMSNMVLDYCLTEVVEKLGDPKTTTQAADTLTALAEATKLDVVATDVLNYAFSQKSPKLHQESLNWVSSAILDFGFVIQPKPLVDIVKKALAATNPVVRNSSIALLGTLYLYMGDDLRMLFDTERPALQQQIFAEFDKHAGDVPPPPTRGLSRSTKAAGDGGEDEEMDYEDDEEGAAQSTNVRELMPRVDISSQITECLVTELADKDWKVRNEAIQKLSNILTKEKFVTNSLGELPPVLAKRLVDSNGKIAVAAYSLCQQLGVAMGAQGKTHIRTFFPGLLQGMGDSKVWVRSAALTCINTWAEQCGSKEFFDGEMIADALKSGSPALRSELWSWLAEKLPTIPVKSISKEELQACIPLLYANLEDRNSDVRKSAQEAVLGFMIHLGYEQMMRATEKLPSTSMTSVRSILENVYPNLPTKPQVKKKADNPAAAESGKAAKSGPAKPAGNRVGSKGKVVAKSGRKKEEDVDTSPLLQANSLKHQRSVDEHKLKVLKWNFTTPREEFVELLRDQMMTANVNKNLIANMLHSDFKFHLKSIESLAEDLPINPAATISNLDLILKWLTLRFFDTNPSVLLKGLEYLQTVFNMLIEEGYNMFDHEASSFLPYLILKIGDPKDAVRNGVRALFTQIQNVYPASKLFAYIMDGLKSKNARQRTECLDLLGSLIESYGLPVCQPSAGVALKEVARQISDRDNSVRNAALNCIVQAYFLEGERVYKLVGQISDKDMSLLEERIKRASKNRPPARVVPPPVTRQTNVVQPVKHEPEVFEEPAYGETSPVEMPEPAPIMRMTIPKPRPMSGPFGLDMNLLERIESNGVELRAPKLQEFDYEFLGSLPAVSPPKAPTMRPSPQPTHVSEPITFSSCRTMEDTLDLVISNLKSPDVAMFRETIAQLDGLIQSNKAMLLLDQADQLVSAVVMQLHLLKDNNRFATDAKQIPVCYRMSFMLLLSFFNNEQLARKVSRDVLKDLVEELITILVEERMEKLDFSEQAIRVINLTVVRAIEKSDHTNATCALITLLHEAVGSRSSTRFLDLAMKCLWKVIKLLPKWDGEVQYDAVLYEIHRFFKEYPPAMWKKQSSDTPLRTLKTILHTLVKMKGDKIYGYLGRINNLQESDLYAYLQKLTKSLKQDDGKHLKKESKSQHRLSKIVHEQLSEIFKKIGSKEESKVGLALLFDFREQHPEADIEPFLRKSSQFFQDYIEQGLHQIEKERRRQLGREDTMGASSTSSLGSADTMLTCSGESVESASTRNAKPRGAPDPAEDSDPLGKNPTYYLQRLRHLQAGAGLDPSALAPPPKTAGGNEFDININRKPHLDRNEPSEPNTRPQAPAVDVENIRKRLEALKTAVKS